MSGTNFSKHRISAKNGSAGPDRYFQNANLVPAPREENLYGGNVGATFTAAVSINATDYYADEGVGAMKLLGYLHATAACEFNAVTVSLTLYRVNDDGNEYIISTAQATFPKLSANGTVTDVGGQVDIPFTRNQLIQGNKIRVAGTFTPSAGVANALLKVDLVKTGEVLDSTIANNLLSSINTYMASANASLTAIDGNLSAIETILTSANASLTALDANASAIETLLTEIFSSIDTLILTATNSIRVNEISNLDQKYYPANLANSAAVVYTAPLTTQSYIIGMDGYGGIGFSYVNAGTASTTLNIFGTMDRAAAAGSEVYFNINQEIDSAASTAGWTVTTSARFTFEDVAGVTGFYKNIRIDIATTANTTVTLNYKTKQLV